MKITKKILDALNELLEHLDGNQAELARKIGISEAGISKMLHGHTHSISDEVWENLHPLIRPYVHIEDMDAVFRDSPHPDCEHLCQHLDDWERSVLRRYVALPDKARGRVMREFEERLQDADGAQKKSGGGGVDCGQLHQAM